MQNLLRLITEARQKGVVTNKHIVNLIREYLQVLILKAIYQSKFGKALSFMGGTCLRICRNIKRYSEDLDFAFDMKIQDYSFPKMMEEIATFLRLTDFEIDLNIAEDKTVQKSFIRVQKILHAAGVSPLKSQKIHVKLEVDTRPVPVDSHEIETYFILKFDENFPILKHTDSTLFAGKIGAILNRAYTKGRDFYDLIWYLSHNTDINLGYLNRSQKQAGLALQFADKKEVLHAITERIEKTDVSVFMKDLDPFLEDSSDEAWINDYHRIFAQAKKQYLDQ